MVDLENNNVRAGFTATRMLRGSHAGFIEEYLKDHIIPSFNSFTTGGAIGGDHVIGRTCAGAAPEMRNHVIVPASRKQIAAWWKDFPDVRVTQMPEGTSYRDRNIAILNDIKDRGKLYAFPSGTERGQPYSGTWMTVRLARGMGIPITIVHYDWVQEVFELQEEPGMTGGRVNDGT